ncbi:hypothetical protein GmHk_04G010069 [Glycine max]|nr:hypothetical protein GmHk_04G010069 [Glycine max]
MPQNSSPQLAVLVSGGVDSSVARQLLHAAGHSYTAFYLKIWFQQQISSFSCFILRWSWKEVSLFVDEFRRKLNSRLHSAGHLLDIFLPRIRLGNLEPGKAYHFPDEYIIFLFFKSFYVLLRTCYCIVTIVSWPWIEYKGTISQNEMQSKQKDLELEDNALIFVGGKVSVDILLLMKLLSFAVGVLPDHVPKVSL